MSIKKITIPFYQDPGHGWFKVPKKLLQQLGIAEKISTYSYMRGDFAYLEEDCDAYLLINSMKRDNIKYSFKDFVSDKSSKIRSYNSYSVKV